jgi:hypothetical protein
MSAPRSWAICTRCCSAFPTGERCHTCAARTAPLPSRPPISRAPREAPRAPAGNPRSLRRRSTQLELYALTLTLGLVAATVFAILGIR